MRPQSNSMPEINLAQLSHLSQARLWPGGKLLFPTAPLEPLFIKSLAFARRCGALCGGLEKIESFLMKEGKGLEYARSKKVTEPQSKKISRLLLLSKDGSERFYRHSESLFFKHEDRLMLLCLDTTAKEIGSLFFGQGKEVKAVLITRKDVVTKVLTSIVA